MLKINGHRTGKHTYAGKDLKGAIGNLLAQEGIEKIVLGHYHNCRHSHTVGSLQFQTDIPAGIRIRGFTGDGIREFYIYIENGRREEIKQYLTARYGS